MVDFDQTLEQHMLDEVSSDKLMEYTQKIASWVRLSGEPGEAKSMTYIEETLKGFGYRTEMLKHPAYISIPGDAFMVVTSASGEVVKMRCMSHAFGVSTPEAGLTGRLVGHEQEYGYKGNIALIPGMASAQVVLHAEGLGSVGQIFISDDYLHESSISPLWGVPTTEALGRLPTTPSVTVVREDGETLSRLMQKGPVVVTVFTEVKTEWREIPLLVAHLDVPDQKNFLLFSSHVDSWYYGAMDNGSANATLIETARLMALNRDKLRRGLRLAMWSGHSHGRFAGSNWYCDAFWPELMTGCVGHINADSTGGMGATVIDELPVMPQTFDVAAAALEVCTGIKLEGKRMGRFADQSFYGLGLTCAYGTFSEQPLDPTGRSIRFPTGGKKSGGLGWWWHTEYDTVDKVDPAFLLRDTRVYVSTVYRILSSKYLPYDFRLLNEYVKTEVALLAQELGTKFDMGALEVRLDEVGRRLEGFYNALESGKMDPTEADAAMVKVSQALVPCAFKENERTDPDPFGAIPAFPAFAGISRLNSVDKEERHMLTTAYLRRRNRLLGYLTQALDALNAYS